MPRGSLVALVVGGFWMIALGIACNSGQRRREPQGEMSPVPAHPAPAAKPAAVPARVAAIGYTAPLAPELRRAFELHSAIKFDPAAREDALAEVFAKLGIDDEAAWSAARATWIRSGVRTVR